MPFFQSSLTKFDVVGASAVVSETAFARNWYVSIGGPRRKGRKFTQIEPL